MAERDPFADVDALLFQLDHLGQALDHAAMNDEALITRQAAKVIRSWRAGLVELSTKVIVRASMSGEAATREVQTTAAKVLRGEVKP